MKSEAWEDLPFEACLLFWVARHRARRLYGRRRRMVFFVRTFGALAGRRAYLGFFHCDA